MLGLLLTVVSFLPQPHIITTTWQDAKLKIVHTVQTDCSKVPTAQQCAMIHKMMVDELAKMFPPDKK